MRLFVFWIVAASVLMVGAVATAHDARPLFVQIIEADQTVRLKWRAPPSVDTTISPTVSLKDPCKAVRMEDNPAQRLVIYHCPDGLAGMVVEIDYPLYNPSLSTLIRVSLASGERSSVILRPDEAMWTVPTALSFWGVARSYFIIGVDHIIGGIDHLLFLAGLIYIARTPRRILITATGFTIAHSITIFLVALDLIRVSVPAVEMVIALSIVFLASEIARPARDTLTWRRPIMVAASFGLVHGAGFAAALSEIGLPQNERIAALAFFNVGVEAGQVACIAAAFVLVAALQRLSTWTLTDLDHPRARIAVGYGLGVTAAFWFFERLAGAMLEA